MSSVGYAQLLKTLCLSPGPHQVSVHNYGYPSNTRQVHIDPGTTTDITVALQNSGDKVSGPFGDIEFKGHPRAAVLLNGTTPDYFVGHVDEFDWNWIWHQRLLVKPGTYQVAVTRKGNTIWSGPVDVKAGERVIVNLDQNGEIKTKDWPQGDTLGPQPRFNAGVASAVVPIAPVTAQLTAHSTYLDCGQPTQLEWKSADAADVSITNLGSVSASGDRTVNPTKTTTYELIAKGPGGEASQSATVKVNAQPTATLNLSQPEVHYHKIGDKVVQDEPTTLNWAACERYPGENHAVRHRKFDRKQENRSPAKTDKYWSPSMRWLITRSLRPMAAAERQHGRLLCTL